MPLIRAQVVIPYASNTPEDVITNTMYFASDGIPLAAAGDLIAPLIQQFYLGVYTTGGLAIYINKASPFIKFYDMSQPEPRLPYRKNMPLATLTSTVTQIPTEVSACLSFHGEPTSGIPMSRMRGRIYLGGLTTAHIDQATTSAQYPRFTSAFRDAITESAEDLREGAQLASCTWVVYSRTSPALEAVFPIVGGWVDDTPDTQRRRGVKTTVRTLWPD